MIDLDSLRPQAHEVEMVAGLLEELGQATAAELAVDVGLSILSVAGILRSLERSGRARRTADGWAHVEAPVRPARRSWHVGRGRSG